jgi:hypothetical protein
MRAGLCTVSAPLAACSPAAALPPSARFLALHLLHQQTLYFIVQAKSRVRELYQQTCLHFAQQGMLDTDLFGLALICGKFFRSFADHCTLNFNSRKTSSPTTFLRVCKLRDVKVSYFRYYLIDGQKQIHLNVIFAIWKEQYLTEREIFLPHFR